MKKVVVITPVKNIEHASSAIRSIVNSKDIQLEFIGLRQGIEGAATYFDQAIIAPEILSLAYQAEHNGADGIIINCLSELGLQAAKELLAIPVSGIFEASLRVVAKDQKRFSILMPQFHPDYIHRLQDIIKIHELQNLLASFCNVDREQDLQSQQAAIAAGIKDAVIQHQAQAIILSSSYLLQFQDLCKQLLATFNFQIPILIPIVESLNYLQQIFDGTVLYKKDHLLPPKKEKVEQWLKGIK